MCIYSSLFFSLPPMKWKVLLIIFVCEHWELGSLLEQSVHSKFVLFSVLVVTGVNIQTQLYFKQATSNIIITTQFLFASWPKFVQISLSVNIPRSGSDLRAVFKQPSISLHCSKSSLSTSPLSLLKLCQQYPTQSSGSFSTSPPMRYVSIRLGLTM